MAAPEDSADVVQVSSRLVYENPWMSLREDQVRRRDGSTGLYAVVDSRDFVLVIPFDGERFHLVEQYRYPVGARLWEFPQGSVDASGLGPEEVAAIELAEESGLAAERLAILGYLHAGYGRASNGYHVLYATGLHPVAAEREHEEQDMVSGSFTLDEIWDLVDSGRMTDGHSLAALALLDRARASWPDARGE